MSIRASKSLLAKDKDTPKRKVPDTPGPVSSLPHFPGESVPNLIAQRCLEALAFLVSANDQTPLFFLTEQEIAVNRRAAKKGKGKEKVSLRSRSFCFEQITDSSLLRLNLRLLSLSSFSSVSSSDLLSSRLPR
jgi:hypothetical protein